MKRQFPNMLQFPPMNNTRAILNPLDDIFDNDWLQSINDSELQYALGMNDKYRLEVNNWLVFFSGKGWLDSHLVARLRSAKTWTSYYSKINELRAGYFLENKLNINLDYYEVSTHDNKDVEFRGLLDNSEIFIEVKTPLDLDRKLWKKGWVNNDDKICDVLEKAAAQLPSNKKTIVILSDDLKMPLLDDDQTGKIIRNCLNTFPIISVVCILGNIYYDETYKMEYVVNLNANYSIEEVIFNNYGAELF